MKLMHIADCHLGMEPEKGRPWAEARRQELWKTFCGIIDICDIIKVHTAVYSFECKITCCLC